MSKASVHASDSSLASTITIKTFDEEDPPNVRSFPRTKSIRRLITGPKTLSKEIEALLEDTKNAFQSQITHNHEEMQRLLNRQQSQFKKEIQILNEEKTSKAQVQAEIHEVLVTSFQKQQERGLTPHGTSAIFQKLLSGNSPSQRHFQQNLNFELDVYTMMTISPIRSLSWCLGCVAFAIQIAFGVLLLIEQTKYHSNQSPTTLLGIPLISHASIELRIAQCFVLLLSAMTQTDIYQALKILWYLPFTRKKRWGKVLNLQYNRTMKLYVSRIFIPQCLKMMQGALMFVVFFVIIVQSQAILALLKDFSSLFVISSVKDLSFHFAYVGYFGKTLSNKAQEAKGLMIELEESEKDKNKNGVKKNKFKIYLAPAFVTAAAALLIGWINIVLLQNKNNLVLELFPRCDILAQKDDFSRLGDQICQFSKGSGTNIEDCGWDGGDCIALNEKYPHCNVPEIYFLGNEICDGGEYNSKDCGFDFGDCSRENNELKALYPSCDVPIPGYIADGTCNGDEYNVIECGYDGGDCISCDVQDQSLIGDGFCDNAYNSAGCLYDGKDCVSSTDLVGENYEGDLKWAGATVGEDDFIYGIPSTANKVLKFNPFTHSSSLVGGDLGNDGNKWRGGVTGHEDLIYGVPFQADSILSFNTTSKASILLLKGHSILKSQLKFGSGVMSNGTIYFIPYNHHKVIKFDPFNNEDPLMEIGKYLGDSRGKWYGSVIGKDGNIYGIPYFGNQVLKINVKDDSTSLIGETYEGDEKWMNGVLAGDGKIYACPLGAKQVLQIDTDEGTTKLVGPTFASGGCSGFIERKDGFLYGSPYNTNDIIRFNPIFNTATKVSMDSKLGSYDGSDDATDIRWAPGVIAKNDHIYAIPVNEDKILAIEPITYRPVAATAASSKQRHREKKDSLR